MTVEFVGTPLNGTAPLFVQFTNLSDQTPANGLWHWDFGDGNTSTEQNPIHVYFAPGEYTVSLTLADVVPTYYTSVLYPYLWADNLTFSVPAMAGGSVLPLAVDPLAFGVPAITSGSLEASVAYQSIAAQDAATFGVPAITAGSLAVTIAYPTQQASDAMGFGVPAITAGSLEVTVSYVDYVNGLAYPDTATFGVPAITSGSLT